MAELKSVAKDTAIYGLSSIIGKFLNYLLVPLYTAKMTVESGGYGIVTNIYAYVAAFDGHPYVRHGNHAVPFC